MERQNVLDQDPTDRTEKWLIRFKELPLGEQTEELKRCSKEFFRQPESRLIRLTPSLSNVPAPADLSEESDPETTAKVQELIAFIKSRFGSRCVDAACAIMSGCETGAEVGAQIGVRRQTADEHIQNLQSPDIQKRARQLGLVTRTAFAKALQVMRSVPTKRVTRRKVARRKTTRRSVRSA